MPRILVVTGASGAGKTEAVRALEARRLPGIACFYFDSIGVPSAEAMARDHGGGEQWQADETAGWIACLADLPDDAIRVAVLEGQMRPSVVVRVRERPGTPSIDVVLLDCSSEFRNARLRDFRQQPELASPRMDNWAAYLRGQADALGLPVIDTTGLTVEQTATRLEAILLSY